MKMLARPRWHRLLRKRSLYSLSAHLFRSKPVPPPTSTPSSFPRATMSSLSFEYDYSRDNILHTYDAPTRTLTIVQPGGYTSALADSLPLHEVTTLRDHSDSPTPSTFPLPALQQAHFVGLTIPPPHFPLPPGCKIYACLGRTDPWDEGEDADVASAAVDVSFPWLILPGLEVLRLSMMCTSATAPPPSDVKHLLISEGESFRAPLPQKLETFALQYDGFQVEDNKDDLERRKVDVCALVKGLPQDTLRTLALEVYEFDLPERLNTQTPDLRGLKALRTLCLPWYLLPEEMAAALPEGVENMAVGLFAWGHKSEATHQLLGVVDKCTRLKRLLLEGWHDVGLDQEALRRACVEKGVVLTLSSGRGRYRWPEETDAPHLYWDERREGRLVPFEFRKELF